MSINGVLEDLPLGDVLQFIHLGRRSGTLFMWQSDEQRAEIGFYEGRIVSAWAPEQPRLGDLLVAKQLIARDVLAAALAVQKNDGSRRSIGQILLEQQAVTREQVHEVITEQIQKTIFELVTWQHGHFHFEVDELHPIDDFALAPGELFSDLDLNTQMMLLEATRIFDERHGQPRSPLPPAPREEAESSLDQHLRRAGLGRSQHPADFPSTKRSSPTGTTGRRLDGGTTVLEAVRCQVVSPDRELLENLGRHLPKELVKVAAVPWREAGNRLPGEASSPVVILDLREDFTAVGDIATLARTRPSAAVVALVEREEQVAAAYEAGAVAVVVADDDAVAACCGNLVRMLSHPQPQGTFGYARRGGLSRVRRVVFDVQTGLLSATMALNLMHVISESVERAILFLVQQNTLVAVGAFGFGRDERPLAEITRGLKLEMTEGSVLRDAIDHGQPQSIDFDEAGLESPLADLLGRPATGQVVVFPVLGAERTISLIYTDNGALDEEIQDIRILELATSQVGVAFENELLRQQLGGEKLDVVFE